MVMLQALLAERFQLAFHRTTKEMPVYWLVAGKKGPKLYEVKDDGGGAQIGSDSAHRFSARNISVAQFAESLSREQQVDRPVLDGTGVAGIFNITLDFAAGDSSDDASGPSIFTALQEQLGLKLEPGKGPVEILVIDRAEKPTGN
jgi:uncharacterized protein (TIGR03435 family)